MPTIRLLLVDDHQVVREGLKRMLELEEDIQVVGEAAGGEDGITQAQRLSPDVVLMDGIAATRQLREKMPDVKVIQRAVVTILSVLKSLARGVSD